MGIVGAVRAAGRRRIRGAAFLVVVPFAALVLTAAALPASPGQAPPGQAPPGNGGDPGRTYVVPATQPEGVVYDHRTQAFYGGSAFTDGQVYKADLAGNARVFMAPGVDGTGRPDPTRTMTHGFFVDNRDRLYIAGVTTGLLHVYQLPAGNKVAEFNTGPGGYINDVAVSPSTGDVYFTDSMRPTIWRVTAAQVQAGTGTPQAIPLAPEVDYGPSARTNNKLEANGIRFTPGGRFIVFDDLNNGQLYRMVPPPAGNPAARQITPITGVTPAQVGNADGLEFRDARTLYDVDNSSTPDVSPGSFDESPERVVTLRLSPDYLTATLVSETTNPAFLTPTAATLAPGNRLLVTNPKFFHGPPGPPYYVLGIPRP